MSFSMTQSIPRPQTADIIYQRPASGETPWAEQLPSARWHRTKRWDTQGDILTWGRSFSDSPLAHPPLNKASAPADPRTAHGYHSRRHRPALAAAAAGSPSALVRKHAHVYEPGHRRVLGPPRAPNQHAQLQRGTAWGHQGAMPEPRPIMGAPRQLKPEPRQSMSKPCPLRQRNVPGTSKVLHLQIRPPLPPLPRCS